MRKAAGVTRRNVAGMSECGDEIVDKFESGVATQTSTVAILPPMTGCMRGELRFSALFCGQRLRIFGAKQAVFTAFADFYAGAGVIMRNLIGINEYIDNKLYMCGRIASLCALRRYIGVYAVRYVDVSV